VNEIKAYFRDLFAESARGWNRFWFTPADPATLCVVRILAGGMLFYTQCVWALDLEAFFGPDSWLSAEAVAAGNPGSWAWSHLWFCRSLPVLWTVHIVSMLICACYMLGLFTRVSTVLAWLVAVTYAHRVPTALYGLDQLNALLALYLSISPCGAMYSLDAWRAHRRGKSLAAPAITANISQRLIQLHLCVLYLFAGLSKLQGAAWWDGTAFWGAVANYEYQSIDMTWLAHWPWLVNFLTHATIAWEISYCALIWPRLTRPIVLALAIPVHMGIVLCLGMPTFGLVMLFANAAFVSPRLMRRFVEVRHWGRTGANNDPPAILKLKQPA
jgi:hypothetical protein